MRIPAIFGEECCRLLGVLVVAHADILPTHLDLSDLGGGGRGCLLIIERGDTCLHIRLKHRPQERRRHSSASMKEMSGAHSVIP